MSDIGGYTTLLWVKRSAELMKRWIELSVFTPVMRGHEGNRPESNVQLYDDEILPHLKKMSDVYVALKPYHIAAGKGHHTVKTGLGEIPVFCRKNSEFSALFEEISTLL